MHGLGVGIPGSLTRRNGGASGGGGGGGSPFLSGLVWNYKLDEAGGANAVDSASGYTLTNHGTVGSIDLSVPGFAFTKARTTNGDTANYLDRTANADLAFGNQDGSGELWFYPTTTAGNRPLIDTLAIFDGTGTVFSYFARCEGSTLKWYSGAAGVDQWDSHAVGTFNVNAWNHIVWSRELSTKQWRFRLNGGSVDAWTSSYSYAGNGTNLYFGLGGSGWFSDLARYQGYIARARGWNRLLSDDDKLSLYNSGNGLDF